MNWKQLQQKIDQMTEEQKEQDVMVSQEPGVVLFTVSDVQPCSDHRWPELESQPDQHQMFIRA